MRVNDAVSGLLLIVFAIAMIAFTTTFPEMPGQRYGPALFPQLIGVGFALSGVVLVIRGLKARLADAEPWGELDDWADDPRRQKNFFLVLAALLAYILVSDYVGFIPTAFVLLLLLLRRFDVGWRMSIVVAVLTTLVVHTVFTRFMLVPLPWGLLQPIAW